jgi:voltage-gated potassium channel
MKLIKYQRIFTPQRLRALVGMAGVARNESIVAQHILELFYWAMLLIVFWLPIQWYLEIRNVLVPEISEVADWIVWSAFVIKSVSLFAIVKRKMHYLFTNWVTLVIIFLGCPLIWIYFPTLTNIRLLRLLLPVSIIVPWLPLGYNFLSRNKLGATLIIAVILTFLSGLLISTFDKGLKDPLNGIWWAWQTITSVSYGDVVPVTWEGKFVAILIMIMGGGLFSLLTANISAFLVKKNRNENIARIEKIINLLDELNKKVDFMESQIEQINTFKGKRMGDD